MSLYDYQASKQLLREDPPFAALIMAAARRADGTNFNKLRDLFPDIVSELESRYHAPGGLLAGEVDPSIARRPAAVEVEAVDPE